MFSPLNILLYTVLDNIYNKCGIPAGQSLLEMVSLTLLYTEAPDHTDTQWLQLSLQYVCTLDRISMISSLSCLVLVTASFRSLAAMVPRWSSDSILSPCSLERNPNVCTFRQNTLHINSCLCIHFTSNSPICVSTSSAAGHSGWLRVISKSWTKLSNIDLKSSSLELPHLNHDTYTDDVQ